MKLELKCTPAADRLSVVDLKIDGEPGHLVQAVTVNVSAEMQVPTAYLQFIPQDLSLDVELDQDHITTDLGKYAQALSAFSQRLQQAPGLTAMPGYEDLLRAATEFEGVLMAAMVRTWNRSEAAQGLRYTYPPIAEEPACEKASN